jgi:site-specific DNA recombinase
MYTMSTTTRTRTVAYLRVSTDRQADRGVSLDAQRAKVLAYADLYDLDLVAVEVDAGASAKSLDRPALARALAMLKRGEAEALLVVKLDRLTRSVRDLADLVDGYFAKRAALLSVSEQIDTRSVAGRLVLNVLSSVGQWEREAIGERTSAAMQHLAAQGRFTGGTAARYGYALGANGETLIAVNAEQAILAKARELRASGLSYRAVAATLDECGLRARNGKRFVPAQVARMMEAA